MLEMYGCYVEWRARVAEEESRARGADGILSLRRRLCLVTGTLLLRFLLAIGVCGSGVAFNLQMAAATAEGASDLYLAAGRGVDGGDCRIGKRGSDHEVGKRGVDSLGQPV